tara:strand:- start:270 stop:1007 length:738 start_codon:yes stop_codon:yes gene_type:complete
MQAIILAAGIGKRISSSHDIPKILLKFNEKTLLERHISNLQQLGTERIIICTGYKQELICRELKKIDSTNVEVVSNEKFHLGSTVSLLTTQPVVGKKEDTLLMDADVLYHPEIINKLANSQHKNCLLIDKEFDEGVEPVKVCMKNQKIVEFRKKISLKIDYDTIGESVGFFKFSANGLKSIFQKCESFVADGREHEPHEEVIRESIIYDNIKIEFEDVSGLPWLEIDFPEDIVRATKSVLPQLPS